VPQSERKIIDLG